jgi:hypothetical protein
MTSVGEAVQLRAPALSRSPKVCVSVSEITTVRWPLFRWFIQIPMRSSRKFRCWLRSAPFQSSSAGKGWNRFPAAATLGRRRLARSSSSSPSWIGPGTDVSICSGPKCESMWFTCTVVSGVDCAPCVASAKISGGVAFRAPADGKSIPGGAACPQSVEPPDGSASSIVNG